MVALLPATHGSARAGAFRSGSRPSQPSLARALARSRLVVRASAEADPDAELEKRLTKLRQVKGATPYGEGSKANPGAKKASTDSGKPAKPVYDYTGETLHYEGGPAQADLYFNLALGTTLVWIPLTLAAVGRALYVKYRFTDRRFTVTTNAPWQVETSEVAYQEVRDVTTVGRALGLWGDLIVTLRDGSKVEMRSVENYRDIKKYILERRDALGGSGPERSARDILMADEPTAAAPSKKGFSS